MIEKKRTFVVDIKYPECDELANAEDYLQELIEGDLVGDDIGRWCVNVKEIPEDGPILTYDEFRNIMLARNIKSNNPKRHNDIVHHFNPNSEHWLKQFIDLYLNEDSDETIQM